jgi:c(7)-type cytochrome triheme protein
MKIILASFFTLSVLLAVDATGHWTFPPPPPVEEYGNVLINRTSEKNNVKPVSFSHWMHRRKHTCRVCHFELEFGMKVGTTEITEEANKAGRYCGACHDGRELFGHSEGNCGKCHDGNVGNGAVKFTEMWRFPSARYGNRIDWSAALEEKWITPVRYLSVPPMPDKVIDKKVELDAVWSGVSPSVFPHRKHTNWLDCNDCHPEPFRIQEKQSGVRMSQILNKDFCGQCHGSVAFPLTDCIRCHPRMKSVPKYPEPTSR